LQLLHPGAIILQLLHRLAALAPGGNYFTALTRGNYLTAFAALAPGGNCLAALHCLAALAPRGSCLAPGGKRVAPVASPKIAPT
jgi:hypothetical protein